MNIEILCKAIKKNLETLKGRKKGVHEPIEKFQDEITESLNSSPGNDIPWKTEQEKGRRPEQDKVDILGGGKQRRKMDYRNRCNSCRPSGEKNLVKGCIVGTKISNKLRGNIVSRYSNGGKTM